MEIYAKDYGIGGLVMPEELSKVICDYARVKIPDDRRIGKWGGACAICFGNRPCHKKEGSRYCKGCYYEYGGGGFGHDNTYEEFEYCVKCGGKHQRKAAGYINCPLCMTCYQLEKENIYPYLGKDYCECGNKKPQIYNTCWPCKKHLIKTGRDEAQKIEDARKLKANINSLIQDFKKSRLFQLDDDE
tara:strand:- start:42 stop:602 length:561 start_codon:yes stop_codon:yes gene_type:complete